MFRRVSSLGLLMLATALVPMVWAALPAGPGGATANEPAPGQNTLGRRACQFGFSGCRYQECAESPGV